MSNRARLLGILLVLSLGSLMPCLLQAQQCRDPMAGDSSPCFLWHSNDISWSSEYGGYLSGTTGSWYSAVVSDRAYVSSSNPAVTFRVEFKQDQTNYILGFTPTPPATTNYHYDNVTLGLYIHSSGTLRPSWSTWDTGWNAGVSEGVVDIRVTILENKGKIRIQLQNVGSYDDTLSTFASPDWSIEVARPIAEQYYAQINPYSPAGRVYDAWIDPACANLALSPMGDIVLTEGDTVVIAAHAVYAGSLPLTYGISDARYAQEDSVFTWRTGAGDAGVYHPVITVTDGFSVASQAVNVTVRPASEPWLAPIDDIVMMEGDTVVITAHAGYAGSLPLAYGISDARYTQEDSVFTWRTGAGDGGVYHPVVTVTDGFSVASQTVNVTVLPRPWLTPIDDIFVVGGDTVVITAHVVYVGSLPLAYGINDARYTQEDSVFTWRTGAEDTGVYHPVVTVTDGDVVDSATVNVAVLPLPWLAPIDDIVVTEGDAVVITAHAVYAGSLPLAYEIDDARYTQEDSILTWRTGAGDAGVYHPVVTVTDGFSIASRTVNVTVLPRPWLTPIDGIVVMEGDAVVVTAHVAYVGSLPLVYEIDDARYTQEDSVFTWRTGAGDAGIYHPVVTVTDGSATDTATVTVTVLLNTPGWRPDGASVCTATDDQTDAQIVSDGYGGSIIAWIDMRNGNADIYAQRLDGAGMPLWALNGVPVCTDTTQQRDLVMVSDGNHGAYIAWLNEARTSVMGQRIDAAGNRMWTVSGVGVGRTHHSGGWLSDPKAALASDGDLFVSFIEGYPDQYHMVQWFNAGLSCYSPGGSRRFEAAYDTILEALRGIAVAADPFGGAILGYDDRFHPSYSHSHVLRIADDGSTLWSQTFEGGVAPQVAWDGASGVIVCAAGLSGNNEVWEDIWAQRFDSSGQAVWTSNGIPICTAPGAQSIIGFESSGADRFTAVWLDKRSGANEIYAQSVDTAGTAFWQTDGVRINGSHGVGALHGMASDGFGGAFVAWSDGPLFAQHITSSGTLLWGAGADTLRSGPHGTGSLALARAEECGVVAAWNDERSGEMDVFANSKSTAPCIHPPVLAAIGNKRTDVGVELSIQLAASDPDAGDVLAYGTNAGSVLPSAFGFDTGTGLFSWTPASGDAGDYRVTFSVTDGPFMDTETIVISVYEHDTRPPDLEPIENVTVITEMTVVIEGHATDPDGDTLTYSISDARFTRSGNVFSWQTTAADAGRYRFVVSVTDGYLSDTASAVVSVLDRAAPFIHDPMSASRGSQFWWKENRITWHAEQDGYMSGEPNQASWYQAVVSQRAFDASGELQAVFRLQFAPSSTYYMIGFAETPPEETDFYYRKVTMGLYVHGDGTLRPPWSINESPWEYTVQRGIIDVRITLRGSTDTIVFELERVDSFDDPLSAFESPDWSAVVSRPIAETYYLQVNTYSSGGKVYDVWWGDPCGGLALAPMDDVVGWESGWNHEPLVVEAHATCLCGCTLSYWMSDPRFMQVGEGVFSWYLEGGDAGEYNPVVYVTDGTTTDSVTVKVTVLRPRIYSGYYASMASASDGFLVWRENGVVWHGEEQGYLSGPAPADWHAGVVSGVSFGTAPRRSLLARFLRDGNTNTMIGFTFTPPRENDFDSRNIDCGVYVDSTGSVYPTGTGFSPDAWIAGLHEGLYDLKIDIDPSTSTVTRSLVRVPLYSDPIPDFSTVVWSFAETTAIADSCWIQINPYDDASKIYYVGCIPFMWVEIESSSASMDGGAVVLVWTLTPSSAETQFFVSREENGDGVFEELVGIPIEQDGLTYTARDTTCAPGASYRYLVEAHLPTGRTTLFYQSIKTPAVPLALLQNVPNPFAAITTIGYDLPGEDRVTMDVYDVLGRNVARLVDTRKTGGRHTIDWNGNDKNGRRVSSGIYFYRIEWRGQTISRKMILLR